MIKYYNSGMGVVDLLVQKTATYWLNPKSSGGWYYLRFFLFRPHEYVYGKEYHPKGMELLNFEVVVAKSLIASLDSRQINGSPFRI